MSIPALLRRVGLSAPRGVSIDGRILFGEALAASLAEGTASPLIRHTFHGGEQTAPPCGPPWWSDDDARERDVAAVRAAFPGFHLDQADGGYSWQGTLNTGHGRFEVRVEGSPANRLPRVRPVRPAALGRNFGRRGLMRPEHMFLNGDLCVADESDFDPARDTTATVIAWVAHWYAAYVDWRIDGRWVVEGYRPRATA